MCVCVCVRVLGVRVSEGEVCACVCVCVCVATPDAFSSPAVRGGGEGVCARVGGFEGWCVCGVGDRVRVGKRGEISFRRL